MEEEAELKDRVPKGNQDQQVKATGVKSYIIS